VDEGRNWKVKELFLLDKEESLFMVNLLQLAALFFDGDSVDFNKRRVFDIPCGYFALGNVNGVKALN
jgi:hypothetical protein